VPPRSPDSSPPRFNSAYSAAMDTGGNESDDSDDDPSIMVRRLFVSMRTFLCVDKPTLCIHIYDTGIRSSDRVFISHPFKYAPRANNWFLCIHTALLVMMMMGCEQLLWRIRSKAKELAGGEEAWDLLTQEEIDAFMGQAKEAMGTA
jgi:hypothetical protein